MPIEKTDGERRRFDLQPNARASRFKDIDALWAAAVISIMTVLIAGIVWTDAHVVEAVRHDVSTISARPCR